MDGPLIRTRDLTKVYRIGDHGIRALDGVSLDIAQGEFIAVMGPSGSGKSTLMNMLGCLDRPSSGDYLLGGRKVSELDGDELAEVRNRNIGFVFQTFNLLARTSSVDNVALPLRYAGVGLRERRARARKALAEVGLSHREEHTPDRLSGGERQRVAIARAIVNQPKLLLADEPTGNLDSISAANVADLLFRLRQDAGMTLILVTHDDGLAARCPRRVRIKDGIIVEDTGEALAPRSIAPGATPRQATP
jgi:putative ABC transport system ATP-binding protein